MHHIRNLMAGIGLFVSAGTLAWTQVSACDLNQDSVINDADIKLATAMALGTSTCTANIAGLGVCNVVVVQRIINASLGGACVIGTGPIPHSVSLTWAASVSPNITGYHVYRGTTAGGPYTRLTSALVPMTTYTDSDVRAGQNYYYVTTAVNSTNVESSYSNQAQAIIPTP